MYTEIGICHTREYNKGVRDSCPSRISPYGEILDGMIKRVKEDWREMILPLAPACHNSSNEFSTKSCPFCKMVQLLMCCWDTTSVQSVLKEFAINHALKREGSSAGTFASWLCVDRCGRSAGILERCKWAECTFSLWDTP